MTAKREWQSREVVKFWAQQAALLAAALAGIEGGTRAFAGSDKTPAYQTVQAAQSERDEITKALIRIESKIDKANDRIDAVYARGRR